MPDAEKFKLWRTLEQPRALKHIIEMIEFLMHEILLGDVYIVCYAAELAIVEIYVPEKYHVQSTCYYEILALIVQ